MLKKVLGVTAAFALAPVAAQAASFTVFGGTASTLPTNFNPSGGVSASGAPIQAFSAATGGSIGGGLLLDGPATITATFLGKEAGARNSMTFAGGASLSNRDAIGSSVTASFGSGIVDFAFTTLSGGTSRTITSGGTTTLDSLSMAFGQVSADGQSILAFFGDGRGDSDFDDMVVRFDIVAGTNPVAVPVPASSLALGAAMLALSGAALRRRRK